MSIDTDSDDPVPVFEPEELDVRMNVRNLAKYARVVGTRIEVTYTGTLERESDTKRFEIVAQEPATGSPYRFKGLHLEPLADDEDTPHHMTLNAYSHLTKRSEGAQFETPLGNVTQATIVPHRGGNE